MAASRNNYLGKATQRFWCPSTSMTVQMLKDPCGSADYCNSPKVLGIPKTLGQTICDVQGVFRPGRSFWTPLQSSKLDPKTGPKTTGRFDLPFSGSQNRTGLSLKSGKPPEGATSRHALVRYPCSFGVYVWYLFQCCLCGNRSTFKRGTCSCTDPMTKVLLIYRSAVFQRPFPC